MKSSEMMFCICILCLSVRAYCIEIDYPNINDQYSFEKCQSCVKIHSMRGRSGDAIGDVYVKYLTGGIFTSLLITKANNIDEVLYIIDREKFISHDGIDIKVFSNGFYGYKAIMLKDDYIVINYLRNNGKNVSDDITIEWDYDNRVFHVLKTP